jgi:alkylation response protein AidB-like acyl-CoA dehydrogenase
VFDLSPDDIQSTIIETLREFSKAELRPLAREAEKAGEPPEVATKQLVEMGFHASIPEEFGGAGEFSTVTASLIAEELAWGDPGIAAAIVWSSQVAVLVRMAGTDEQKSELLPQFASGEFIKGSLMLYEHPPLSAGARLQTTARRSGKDWILEGEKSGVLWPSGADVRIVVAGIEGSDQAGAFVLPKDASIEVRRNDAKAGKIGLRAAPTGEVCLRRVVVKGNALLGDGAAESGSIERALAAIRLQTGAIAVGLARAATEYAAQYATERIAFGKPIGAFQGISFMIADMATAVDGARLAVWAAADEIDKGAAASRSVAIANSAALDAALRCGTDSVQVLGGHGFITDHPVEKWYRDAAALDAFEGSLDARAYLAAAYAD